MQTSSSSSPSAATRQLLQVTEAAAAQVKKLLADAGGEKPVIGLRIGLKTRGCSGMAYAMEYATEETAGDEVVDAHGVKIFIDPRAVMYLAGTHMDYRESDYDTGFVFKNPNEKGRCGCGESFHV